MAQELDDIISELQDINFNLDLHLGELVTAIENLTTEVRIAGGSDVIPGRREFVEQICSYETLIKIDNRNRSRLLTENGNNYEAEDVKKLDNDILFFKKRIEDLKKQYL